MLTCLVPNGTPPCACLVPNVAPNLRLQAHQVIEFTPEGKVCAVHPEPAWVMCVCVVVWWVVVVLWVVVGGGSWWVV